MIRKAQILPFFATTLLRPAAFDSCQFHLFSFLTLLNALFLASKNNLILPSLLFYISLLLCFQMSSLNKVEFPFVFGWDIGIPLSFPLRFKYKYKLKVICTNASIPRHLGKMEMEKRTRAELWNHSFIVAFGFARATTNPSNADESQL